MTSPPGPLRSSGSVVLCACSQHLRACPRCSSQYRPQGAADEENPPSSISPNGQPHPEKWNAVQILGCPHFGAIRLESRVEPRSGMEIRRTSLAVSNSLPQTPSEARLRLRVAIVYLMWGSLCQRGQYLRCRFADQGRVHHLTSLQQLTTFTTPGTKQVMSQSSSSIEKYPQPGTAMATTEGSSDLLIVRTPYL